MVEIDKKGAEIMGQKGKISAKRWILLFFFLFMMACTIISRIYDTVTVPKVLTTTAKRKNVETLIEGKGTVKEKGKGLLYNFIRTSGGKGDCRAWLRGTGGRYFYFAMMHKIWQKKRKSCSRSWNR